MNLSDVPLLELRSLVQDMVRSQAYQRPYTETIVATLITATLAADTAVRIPRGTWRVFLLSGLATVSVSIRLGEDPLDKFPTSAGVAGGLLVLRGDDLRTYITIDTPDLEVHHWCTAGDSIIWVRVL